MADISLLDFIDEIERESSVIMHGTFEIEPPLSPTTDFAHICDTISISEAPHTSDGVDTYYGETPHMDWIYSNLPPEGFLDPHTTDAVTATTIPEPTSMIIDTDPDGYQMWATEFGWQQMGEVMSVETMGAMEIPEPLALSNPNSPGLSFDLDVILDDQQQVQVCPRCGRTIGGQPWHLNKHMRSSRCHPRSSPGVYTYPDHSPVNDAAPDSSPSAASTFIGDASLENRMTTSWGSRGSGCPGGLIDWGPGDIFTKFPWQILARQDSGVTLAHAESRQGNGLIYLRSTQCDPTIDTGGEVCQLCAEIGSTKFLKRAEERARLEKTSDHLNTEYLTHAQAKTRLFEKAETILGLRQKLYQQDKSSIVLHRKLDDNKRFISALASGDVPRIQHLIASGIRNNKSVNTMYAELQSKIVTMRSSKQFNQTDLDLARLVQHLGGRKLLFALNKALGIPSVTVLARSSRRRSMLLPSVGSPTTSELQRNCEISFPRSTDTPRQRGYCLMIDGLAIRRGVRWLRSTNFLVGLCREHSGNMDMSTRRFSGVEDVWKMVHGDHPTVHYGGEATVAAVGAFDEVDYAARPIMISATCKMEKAPEFAMLEKRLLEAFDNHAAQTHGTVWCLSTDGDSTFRLGSFQLCTTKCLVTGDRLYSLLGGLQGLNITCGDNEITYTTDPKHGFKRDKFPGVATWLRSKDGALVNGQHLNSSQLQRYFALLPGMDDSSARILIDPADHQNVPRAVKLLRTIGQLKDINLPYINPVDEANLNAWHALDDLISAGLLPFISKELDLTDQLSSLSKFSHLLFAHYRKHGPAFISNPLYADLQGITKTTFFCVAKQQLLDSDRPFYLYQLGSDRLEEMFGALRSMTHDQNVDVLQLAERLSGCNDINQIFNDHPEWKRAQRRLSFLGSEGVDHLNPKYFEGNLIVGSVDLEKAWRLGRTNAEASLQSRRIVFDFEKAFSGAGIDFLCPIKGGDYVGTSNEPDRSIMTAEVSADNVDADPTVALEGGSDVQGGEASSQLSETCNADNPPKDEIPDECIHLEDFISDTCDENGDYSTSDDIPTDWLEVPTGKSPGDTKRIHKASIVSYLFQPGGGKLSSDRLARVRGYTKDFKREDEDTYELGLGEAILRVGDLVIGAVRVGDRIAPAIIYVSNIVKGSTTMASIGCDKLRDPANGFSVVGQVLVLELCDLGGSRSYVWVWTGEYAQFVPPKKKTQKELTVPLIKATDGTRDMNLLTVSGQLLAPISEFLLPIEELPESNIKTRLALAGKKVTYFFNREGLETIVSTDFGSLPLTAFERLPNAGSSQQLPYTIPPSQTHPHPETTPSGTPQPEVQQFLINHATNGLNNNQIVTDTSKVACYQCGADILLTDLRGHVGEYYFNFKLDDE
ncbi:hypothetical protein ONZ45_g9334 [Pleurotus djamor]|nr:hypothetical protein ONZ45_g9334 [Pleurotus djamor]